LKDAPLWEAFTGLRAEFGKATKAALRSTFSAEGKFFRVIRDSQGVLSDVVSKEH